MLDRERKATWLVDKLLQKKLVNRCQCAGNGRKADIVINPAGLELLNKKANIFNVINTRFCTLTR